MTLITLDKENFVNTKVTNRFKINYKNSDNSTFVYDSNLDSKSILHSQPDTLSTFDNSLIGLQENSNINEMISRFFDYTYEWNNSCHESIRSQNVLRDYTKKYFEKKDKLHIQLDDNNNQIIFNNNLKDYNFKNSFKINRTVNTFLPQSFELSKFNTVNNCLYDYYNKDFTKDFYPEVDYGFCNYNTINFFSQKYNTNRTHSNCIVYSNQKNGTINDIDLSNNFSINLWINIRKNNNTSSGCIMHIPDVFSLYSIESNDKYRFCITTGSNTKKDLNATNFPNINFNNINSQSQSSIYLTDNNTFDYNNWYNITVNFNKKNNGNDYIISLYRNGILEEVFNGVISREKANIFNSFICLGNKPNYYKSNTSSYNVEYEDIFYTFFGKEYSTNDNFNGPYYKKDLNLGLNTSYNEVKNVEDIVNNDKYIYFEDDIQNSSSFHGEIYNIKIYTDTLDSDYISNLYSETISDISQEIANNKLSFFVPVFYLPLDVKKVGLFNCALENINLYYNAIYNPFLANSTGGRDISVENYLVDFVKSKKPNVIISGFEKRNVYKNYYEELHGNFIDNTNDFQKIKKGVMSDDIFIESLENLALDNSNKFNNISYRNIMVLPCDNGIPTVKFEPISYFLSSDTVYNKESNFFTIDDQNKPYHIDCLNTLKFVNYSNNNRINNVIVTERGNDITLKLSDTENLNIFSTENLLHDVSNYLYHDNTITTISDFVSSNSLIDSYIQRRLDIFSSYFIDTRSNPVVKDYKSQVLNFSNNDILLSEDITYRYLPVPFYTLNKLDNSLFSIIIDISSQYYNKKIKKGTFSIKDSNIINTNGTSMKLSDNKKGSIYRDDCLTKVADWNYVGHLFYKEGFCTIHHTSLYNFGKSDFTIDFVSEGSMYVHETNIPIHKGELNVSNNSSYNRDLRLDESSFNSDEPFVYITDINMHDENLNIVAKAKMAHPIPKKNTDNLLVRLKMDY